MREFFLVVFCTLITFIPTVKVDYKIDINRTLADLQPYNKKAILIDRDGLLEKEIRKYYLICEDSLCTKKDTIYATEQAMIIQDSIGVQIYRVSDLQKANCVLYLKNEY